MIYPAPHLCRLEYLSRKGWVIGGTIALLDPSRYVVRLADRGKVGRATDLETGEVWQPDEIPDPTTLHPSKDSVIPSTRCSYCGTTGHAPGECLL